MAIREKQFGVTADTLMRMQAHIVVAQYARLMANP